MDFWQLVWMVVAVVVQLDLWNFVRGRQLTSQDGKRLFRVTRMSVLDYWKNETSGDGLNLTWAHHVNSWTRVNEHVSDPGLNKSLLIEGDVFLRRQSSAIPVMAIPAIPNQTITFKQWLQHVAEAKKAIKINFRSTSVVRPALQYLFASQKLLDSPVILHADIMKGPNSLGQERVNPKTFVYEAVKSFPDATISVGWTESLFIDEQTSIKDLRYSWRNIFDILEYTYDLHQPVMYSVRAAFAAHSFPQVLWLLGIRDTFSLLISSEDGEEDLFADWSGLVALRKFAQSRQILYDLQPLHRDYFLEKAHIMEKQLFLDPTPWHRESWRVVQFINPTAMLSTIIPSQRSVAFLGWPTAFLLSEKTPQKSSKVQDISGRVLFVPKTDQNMYSIEESGLSIFLLPSVQDIGSPRISGKGEIHVFIGFNGKVFIENRALRHGKRGRRRHAANSLPKAVSQMMKHDCYGFSIRDTNSAVQLNVYTTKCSGSLNSPPKHSWFRTLRLRVPESRTRRQRHVLVQKTGDGTVDVMVEHLFHSNGVVLKPKIRLMSTLLVPLFIAFTRSS